MGGSPEKLLIQVAQKLGHALVPEKIGEALLPFPALTRSKRRIGC